TLRDQQSGAADVGGERPPKAGVVGLRRLGPREHCRCLRFFLEHRPDRRAELGLLLGVSHVRQSRARSPSRPLRGGSRAWSCLLSLLGHRGRSFHGLSLSSRISGGNPSTRSATMLRRISDVPPSIELPLERKNRYPASRP